jgi:hypothetical protein
MSAAEQPTWMEANRRYLMAEVGRVRAALENRTTGADLVRTSKVAAVPEPALDRLCAIFQLSEFERNVLLSCAAMELDSRFAAACATAQDNPRRAYPTFSLALGAFREPHWSAISPAAPLRYWKLIEVGTGETLTTGPLRIDERILHFLTGTSYIDERLQGLVEALDTAERLPASHQGIADQAAALWSRRQSPRSLPVIQFCGDDLSARQAVAAETCALLELALFRVSAGLLPAAPAEAIPLFRLLEREAALSGAALLVECQGIESADARNGAINLLVETGRARLMLSRREHQQVLARPLATFEVHRPLAAEQHAIWRNILGTTAAAMNGQIEAVVAQFNLSAAAIRAVAPQSTAADGSLERLWDICRAQARPQLEHLAQRVAPAAVWDDLVLPEEQCIILREIAAQVRQRAKVYGAWGFARKSERGLGISALFSGASGTGKTLAAEVLAGELRLDLYRIDLSQVVSKYIGETEKNLRQIFDAAEEGGAILFFDEADALFGKRSEVKDSHDRFANIEIAYLLQRMESYRGLAVLATNMKAVLDQAFLRRIRFCVPFPFPTASMRAEIWRRVFPQSTPTEGLDPLKLAQLNVPGGNIRNIAMNAAFLAAEADEPVRMIHLLNAARNEYAKIEKPLTEVETGGWV